MQFDDDEDVREQRSDTFDSNSGPPRKKKKARRFGHEGLERCQVDEEGELRN